MHNSEYTKIIKLRTLKGWNTWYVSYVLIKLFKIRPVEDPSVKTQLFVMKYIFLCKYFH